MISKEHLDKVSIALRLHSGTRAHKPGRGRGALLKDTSAEQMFALTGLT